MYGNVAEHASFKRDRLLFDCGSLYQRFRNGAVSRNALELPEFDMGGPVQLGITPPTAGATYLIGEFDNTADFSLLQLNSLPSSKAAIAFSGWDANNYPVGAAVTDISHPLGYGKSIAFGSVADNSAPEISIVVSSGGVDHGSSGSGLFSSPQYLVGVLSGAPASQIACVTQPQIAYATSFSYIYQQIKQYIEDVAPPDIKAQIVSPVPGSTLPYNAPTGGFGASPQFWAPASATGLSYRLLIGSAVGSNDFYDSGDQISICCQNGGSIASFYPGASPPC